MKRIEDYALLGDLQTAALIDREGSIDWCCFPRFDSGACFAALLGGPENGRWQISPTGSVRRHQRRYRHDTLILESVFETPEGSVRAIDFMPPRGRAPDIVRIVEGLDGRVPMRSELVIRFDHGRTVPWVRRVDDARLAVAGPNALRFDTPVEVHGESMSTVSEFTVEPGQRVPLVLTWFPSHEPMPPGVDAEQALEETESYWLAWARAGTVKGDYRDAIHRSLIVLKALTYAPTGGIVAAPTTSLPEEIGGIRNWDYRYCWLRDATLTLVSMLGAGYREEALAWRDWLLRAVAGDPAEVQIMYGIAGERVLDEREIPWLPGFEGSGPVRIGNAASTQLQLDVYGELLDMGYQALSDGEEPSEFASALMGKLLEWLEDGWRNEDAGIWEVRGEPQHFTHSKVMAWVAFDRAVRIHDQLQGKGTADRWRALRDEIHADVMANAWSDDKQAFVQSYGTEELDAAVLHMPLVGFLPATDPRIASTVDAIRRELTVDGLLLRYHTQEQGVDGLPPGEGVFLACTFWLATVLEEQGHHDEAREIFERLLDLRNDVGLLSEEYDPVAKRQLGNFPQALTHLALVSTALALDRHRSGRRRSGGR
jgi:GH15 family glucan-1,4-alpha-glucosidase